MKLSKLPKLPKCPLWLSICQTPGGFAVTGGNDSVICSMYVLATNSWVQLVAFPLVQYFHGSIYFGGMIFVFGGWISGVLSSSVQSLHLDGGEWNVEPNLPHAVGFPAVACVDSRIFLLDIDTGKLLHLDVNMKVWSHKQNLPGGSCNRARMIAVDDNLLVAGGLHKTFARYNPSTDTWTTGNRPALEHDLGGLVYTNGKVYLIGGQNEDRVQEYSLDNMSWAVCSIKVPKKVGNLYAFALDD